MAGLHTVKPGLGKVFFVGDSSTVDLSRVQQMFNVDPDGDVRYFDDLEECLASGAVVANRGDVIFLAPGHAETVSSASAIALDIADINIIGLGNGTDRPTITFDTATTATIAVSANNIVVENVIITANFADIVAPFTLTTAKYFTLRGCTVQATATDMNFLSVIDTSTTDNAADGLTVENCSWIEPDTATLSFIDVDADLDKLRFVGNYLNLGVNTSDLPAIAIVATGKDLTNVIVSDNDVIRLNDANPLLITADTTTANTGIVANNRIRHLDVAGELLVTAGTNIGFFENKATAAVNTSGYLVPVADS